MERDRLLAQLAGAGAAFPPERRITAFLGPDGRQFWLKRVERRGLRGRMTKGSARRSFENDRTGLRVLAKAGVPVAPILAEGPDFFVTPDLGPTLQALISDPAADRLACRAAFAATGAALARLHRRGLCHGRPSVRDTCWDGTTARFIDLERFSPRRTGLRAFATDLLIFLWSGYSVGAQCRDDLEAMAQAYLASAPQGTQAALARQLRWLSLLHPVLAVFGRLRPGSRELRAVSLTMRHAGALAAGDPGR